MSEPSAAHANHPIRAHSEGDIPDQESPTYKSPGHAPLKHVASYTFGSKKFGGRSVKKQWKFAALKTKELPDPWVGLGFDKIKEEVATRHMYNPRSGKWKTDKITIKMQSEVRRVLTLLYRYYYSLVLRSSQLFSVTHRKTFCM